MAIKKINLSLNSPEAAFKESGINGINIKTISREALNDGSIYKINEKIEINLSNTMISDSESLSALQSQAPLGGEVMLFDIQNISPRESLASDNSDYGLLSYGIGSVYNYYAVQYEELIEDLPENELINIYISSKNGTNDSSSDYRHFGNTSITRDTFEKSQQRVSVSYLPENLSLTESPEIIYPQNYNFMDISPYKKAFPFGINMSIATDNFNHKFRTFLKKTTMYQTFVQSFLSMPKKSISLETKFNDEDLGQTTGNTSVSGVNLMSLDFNSFLSIASSPSNDYFALEEDSAHGRALKVALLQGFMRQISLDETHSFSEIVSGKTNYYEPIFYKIQKSLGESPGQILQTYIVPADKNIINYFDTQVKSESVYTYTITECSLVVGSRPNIVGSMNYNPDNKAEAEVEISPVLYMLEVPIIEDTVTTVCNPPVPPKMSFYTKNNFDNKIYMRLYTSGVGQVVDNYYPILQSDMENVETLRYKNRFFDQYVYENKNNIIQSYEVMRLSKKPMTLQDFRDGTMYNIEDKILFGSVTVSATIKPDRKYYYLCRSTNQYGTLSNHSVIYEVQLLKGSSTSSLKVNSYTFTTEAEDYHFRTMTRLMQVTPASEHTIYTGPDSDDTLGDSDSYKRMLSKTSIGQASYPIWGEKFKIRVTSNNTGRKIDFNLDFNLIKKKTIEEIK